MIPQKSVSKKPINQPDFIEQHASYLSGLVITTLSVLAFLICTYAKPEWSKDAWIITYTAVWLHAAILIQQGKMKFFWKAQPAEFASERLLWWQLWLISCFAFNKTMPIFHESVLWVDVILIINFVAVVLYHFTDHIGSSAKVYVYLIMPGFTLLMGYFAVYLIPYYVIAIPGILLLGISLHAIVPLVLLIYQTKILANAFAAYRSEILFGLGTPLLFVVFFIYRTNEAKTKLEDIYQQESINNTSALPNWVQVAQQIEHNWITERLLLADDIYQIKERANAGFFSIEQAVRNSSEQPRHDPLVFVASLFIPKMEIPANDRVKILESGLNYRKFQGERFWRGDDLRTRIVKSNVRIYPQHRMAYTEKTLVIHNDATWGNQEAIYTFSIPEGSVATSLSLWVNGKEETGYLTTKSKSGSAYNQVVNIESRRAARDPSVLNWLEGNRLIVKVFPCPAGESREVKIGITSPLVYENSRLIYRNSPFAGPTSDKAKEYLNLAFDSAVEDISAPSELSNGKITSRGYEADWEVSFAAPELSSEAFSFKGKSYRTEALTYVSGSFKPTAIYLDINRAWKRSEVDDILENHAKIPVYVFDGMTWQLTSKNSDVLFDKLTAENFSLFPVYEIKQPENALFVTKSTPTGPFLNDIGASYFSTAMKRHAASSKKLRTISLNGELPNHLKMWEEVDKIERVGNGMNALINMLKKGTISTPLIAKNEVKLPAANIKIVQKEQREPSDNFKAPDHLKRLFDYNFLMQEFGSEYLTKNNAEDLLIETAQEANIVTPVSSLIVLETQADYERFDIEKSTNTLDNATLKKLGSVPEPHEWMLIIAFAAAALWIYLKKI